MGEQHFIITLVLLLLARGLAIGFNSTSVKTDKQYAYGQYTQHMNGQVDTVCSNDSSDNCNS